MKKSIIILVVFGASTEKTKKSLVLIENLCRQRFPHSEISWAYTSKAIRARLLERKIKVHSPKQAVEHYAAQGHKRILIQSLQVIPGIEFEELSEGLNEMQETYPECELLLGRPLLGEESDLHQVSELLLKEQSPKLHTTDHLIYIGHGSPHRNSKYYHQLGQILAQKNPKVQVATLESSPSYEDVLRNLSQLDSGKKVILHPLMSLAGYHTTKDIAGNDDSSWVSRLETQGYNVQPIQKGLLEYESFCQLWLDHAQDALG
ncbi:MAG: sirohydrochlorin cobaltochelatase [Planctomycetes bacterium]|nr:sirohydrochlorin cobaltochelatase [Planctomycetota bacterium]